MILFNLIKIFGLCLLIIYLNYFSFAVAKEDVSTPSKTNENFIDEKIGGDDCSPGEYFWVIYDNVCPYCQGATKHIKSLDWEGKFKFLSYRNPFTYKMFPQLSQKECEKDVHMVTPEGKVLAGYEVFRAIIDNLTATKILNPLLHNDFAEKELNKIYEKMVFERSCYYDKSGTCDLKKMHKKD